MEEFLSTANIANQRELYPGAKHSWRVSLADGKREHDAAVEAQVGSDLSQRNYKHNVAAYELNKLLELNLVPPSVERSVHDQPASVTWWLDDVAMSEVARRRKQIAPPDPDVWNKQMQAVRVFDELISNAYRNVSPAYYTSTIWDNLLITSDWKIWLIDHTRTFGISTQLDNLQSLTRCDRTLLRNLRQLNKEVFKQKLGRYLAAGQLDALEVRRELLVKHFSERIAQEGEGAVLYDLPPELTRWTRLP